MRVKKIRQIIKNSSLFIICLYIGAITLNIYAKEVELLHIEDRRTPLASNSTFLQPSSPGIVTYSSDDTVLDASNASEGYVMIKYTGNASLAKVKITPLGQTTYTYNLRTDGQYEVFPFSCGNGTYRIDIYSHVHDGFYATSLSQQISVELLNPLTPFIYPNQYVNFNTNSSAVLKANEFAQGAKNKLDIVSQIYNYVINNVSYDYDKASSAAAGKLGWYIPDVDRTLSSKKAICFDYAALMASMLRSQHIPTKVEVGYVTGGIYHAWINTYVPEIGWINGVIYFDGVNWKLMDPTFASTGNSSKDIMDFVNANSNYKTLYTY